MPSLSSLRPARKPGVPRSTMKAEMPLAPFGAIGGGHDDQHVGASAVRDEGLGAVEHPVRRRRGRPSCACRRRRCRRWARSAPMRPASRRGQRRQPARLLRVGAEHEDVRGAQAVVRGHRQRDRRIDARELFEAEAVVDGATCRRRPTARETESPSSPASASFGTSAPETSAPRPTRARTDGSRPPRTRGPSAAATAARR